MNNRSLLWRVFDTGQAISLLNVSVWLGLVGQKDGATYHNTRSMRIISVLFAISYRCFHVFPLSIPGGLL